MAESIDVNLPRLHVARFPDRCVVCERSSPDSHVRIVTQSLGWWTWALWWFGKPFSVKAPACRRCAWRLHSRRFLSLALMLCVAFAAFTWIWPHFKDSVPRALRKWAMMALAFTCLIPQIIFEIFFAKPFEVTAFADSVDYEFTSRDYAYDFAILNGDAAWVKVDGATFSG